MNLSMTKVLIFSLNSIFLHKRLHLSTIQKKKRATFVHLTVRKHKINNSKNGFFYKKG